MEIYLHLLACDALFTPPLSRRVDLKLYANKLFKFSTRLEAWHDSNLIGLIALYEEIKVNKKAFISNVSVLPTWQKKGVASKLMHECLSYLREMAYKSVELRVSDKNFIALEFYYRHGFVNKDIVNEEVVMCHTFKNSVAEVI